MRKGVLDKGVGGNSMKENSWSINRFSPKARVLSSPFEPKEAGGSQPRKDVSDTPQNLSISAKPESIIFTELAQRFAPHYGTHQNFCFTETYFILKG